MYTNFVPDLFLEVAELTRFKESLDDNGFRQALLEGSIKFGLVKNDTSFSNGRVERDLDNSLNQKTVKIGKIVAINDEGLFITNPIVNNFPIPSDGNWYWLKIKHQYSSTEKGKLQLDANGNLTGVDTEFTKVLRGNPNFPSVIKFPTSASNTLEYEILEVLNDTQAVIVHPSVTLGGTADFYAESDLVYEVVGTFTDGAAIPNDNKYPFKYDSCEVELVPEISLNTKPVFVEGQEFFLARLRVLNGNLVIQDKRTDIWESKGSSKAIQIERTDNPLIGVEAAKWENVYSVGDRNIVEVAWGMRSTNWTIDSSQNIVTFLGSSQGGSYKSVNDFKDGDYNGMRLYYGNGKYSRVLNSIKQGSAINLYVDVLDVDNVSSDGGETFNINDELFVAPDCEEVELRFTANPADGVYNVNDVFTFPVNTHVGKCYPTVYGDTCKYILEYRYKSFKEFTEWTPIVSGSYYTEASFKENGSLKPSDERTVYTYTSSSTIAFIQLTISPNSYQKFKDLVYKGDVIGVNTIINFSPGQILELKVGVDKRYQYITGNITLNDDVYISLSRQKAVEGNEFRLHFNCESLVLSDKKIYILDDYASGAIVNVKTLTQADAYEMLNREGGIVIDCVFDDNGKWIAYQSYDLGQPYEVKMFSGSMDSYFDGTGLGKTRGWYGHALMNGNNGTDDIEDRFILATSKADNIKKFNGADSVILDVENLPPHDHQIYGRPEKRSSGSGFTILQVFQHGPADATPGSLYATAPTGKTGGLVDGSTKPVTVKPKNYALAYVQKLY